MAQTLEHCPIPLAVTGIGCHLPGDVHDTESLWKLLVDGQSAWSPVPFDRYHERAFVHPDPDNKGTTNHQGGHFLNQDIAAFDAEFFGISPAEAKAMDPQQRLLLETSYEAFENAGVSIERLRGSDTAVYAAVFTRDYDRNIYKDPEDIPKYHITGCGDAILSNRLSYAFDLRGPSMTLDTGCSGSMVALHQACQSLRCGETSQALACGASLIISPDHMISMSNLHMLNAQGRSYPFDSRGSGYGRGEGITAVVVKRLADALSNGDPIRAVIRNTGVNQDGKTNGITLPSQRAQEALYRSVYTSAGLDPTETHYIEAHGTGTVAGDSAELRAMAEVFCKKRDPGKPLYVGSIKSNIGHLESSSGLAGLIKAILVLEKDTIPPNADYRTPKEALSLLNRSISIPTSTVPFAEYGPRRISVNSFGYGGMNAHAILEAFRCQAAYRTVSNTAAHSPSFNISILGCPCTRPGMHSSRTEVQNARHHACQNPKASDKNSPTDHLFIVSANSQTSLSGAVTELLSWLASEKPSATQLRLIADELACRRSLLQWRQYFVASSCEELCSRIEQRQSAGTRASRRVMTVFVFTGQSAQWYQMGKDLFDRYSGFRQSVIESENILRELGSSWSLIDQLYTAKLNSRIHEGEIAQPATTAIQIALVDLLASINVHPQTVIGHSSGEIAAAYTTRAISHRTALKVAYHRGSLPKLCKQNIATAGAMLSVGLSESEVLPYIHGIKKGVLSVACLNSPTSSTVSGDEAAISELAEILDIKGVFNKKLKVDAAYHSHHMRHVAEEYNDSLGHLETCQVRDGIAFVSSVTSAKKQTGFASAYWVDNLVSKVRFLDALTEYRRYSLDHNYQQSARHLLVEVGPHSALRGPIRQTYGQDLENFDYVYTPTLERERDGAQTILELAGKMFSHGYPVDLQEACGSKHRRFPRLVPINLPRYRWDHTKRYWHESQLSKEYRKRPYGSHDLLGVRVINSPPDEPRWRQLLSLAGIPWLAEHAIDGLTTFPGAAYLCMAIEALRQITSYDGSSCDATYVLQDISFMKALIVPEPPGKLEIQLSLRFDDRALRRYDFRVYARSADAMWDEYCRGRIMLDPAALSNGNNAGLRSELRKRCQVSCADPWDSAKLYEQLRLNGNAYGPLFASIKKMVLGSFQAVSQVVMPKGEAATPLSSSEPYIIHPATLDSIMHTSLPIYAAHCKAGSIMPVSIEQLQISSDITVKPAKELTAFTELEHPTHTYAVANAIVFDNGALTARPVLAIDGMKILGVSTSKSSVIGAPETRKMGYQVGWAKDVDFADAAASMDIRRAISLREYCSLLQFKHPSVDVLQIGASQGEWADSIIQHFAGDEGSSIKHDVVLEEPEMEENLFNWQPSQNDKAVLRSNNYSERNSLSECGSKRYDLVLVAVEQRTLDKFAERLGPVRGMLKPGGHLLLNVDLSMCDSALVSGLEKRLCRQNLISLTHLWKNDMANGDANALSVYRATGTMPPSSELPVVVVSNERYGDVSSSIGDALRQKGMQCSMDTWDTLHPDSAGTYIFVCDSRELGLCNANATGFGRIQRVLNTISKAVWLISSVEDSCPDTAVLLGLMRTACSEYDQLRAVTFDVQEMLEDCLSQLLQPITDAIFQLTHSDVYTDGSLETEYTFSKGQLLIPRLIPSPELNEILVEADGQQPAVKSPYMNESCPLRLYDKPFYADGEICFEPDDPIFGSVSADEVIVKINAQALGSEMSNLGSTASASAPSRLKLQEFAGTVVTLGEDVEKDYHIRLGDRVYGWCLIRSSCASYSRCKAQQICHVPCGWDMALAAASPSAIMTAYHTLVEIASVRRGQTILMYGNDCPTTRAAVVIARFLGAEVVVSGVATSQRNRLAEIYDLPSSHILEESGIKLNQRLLDILGHVGVDVVLCTSTAPPSDLWACIAAFGTIVQVVNDGAETTLSGGPLVIGRPFTFAAFDLVSTLGQPSRKIEGLLKKAQDMIQKAKPEFPILLQKVSMGSLRDAISTARTKSSAETIILEADNDTQVNVTRDVCDHFHVSGSRMEENATYVVAGGLGDIGRILCRLMASLGAGNIVVLSRRTLQDQERKDLQNEVDAISCNTDLHIISCDISNPNDVIRAAQIIQDHGLPPVRGVIQAATTLDDGTLERMTAEKFRLPLLTKVNGTRHLHQVFSSKSLDFFIMLSSLSGIIGSRGQGNYVAGNVFQDRFAWSTQVQFGTRYLAIDLGLVNSTSIYHDEAGKRRERNLLRQGFIPISQDQLRAIIHYSLTRATSTASRQIVVGLDGRSLREAEGPTSASRSPMFSHVHESRPNSPSEADAKSMTSLRTLISKAQGTQDASRHITSALSVKLAQLISPGQDKLPVDVPLMEFGLDSLTAIDLKSWIQKECDATVQPSEILDQPNLTSLGEKVVSRSTIIPAASLSEDTEINIEKPDNSPASTISPRGTTGGLKGASAGRTQRKEYISVEPPPPLPLNDLQNTLDTYLSMVEPFLTTEALIAAQEKVEAFQNGAGAKLQAQLSAREQDANIDSWQHDLQVSGVYLTRRQPIHPYGTFYFSHSAAQHMFSQSTKAAVVSAAANEYRIRLAMNQMEPVSLNEEPICMSSQNWLFNANRTPQRGIDKMEKYSSNDYLVAMRGGRFFKIPLIEAGRSVSLRMLASAFECVLKQTTAALTSAASLTADDRDSWARRRDVLKSLEPQNAETLEIIEAAAFVVCLDDSCPMEPSDRCNALLLGNPANRWSDKTLQFIIFENGDSGHVCEHSMLDALSLLQLNAFIQDAIAKQPSIPVEDDRDDGQQELAVAFEEHFFTVDADMQQRIREIEAKFAASHMLCEVLALHVPELSHAFLRRHRIPSKAGVQLVIQLASLIYYGEQHPSWETVSLMPFRKGRLDWIQTVSPAMKSFCRAALDAGTPDSETRTLLREAANTHASLLTKASRGRGCMAHLEALRDLAWRDQDLACLPGIFQDPTWEMMTVTSTRKIKTDATEGLNAQEAGFYMPDPESALVHYEIRDEKGCDFFIQSTVGRAKAFAEALQQAGDRVMRLLEQES